MANRLFTVFLSFSHYFSVHFLFYTRISYCIFYVVTRSLPVKLKQNFLRGHEEKWRAPFVENYLAGCTIYVGRHFIRWFNLSFGLFFRTLLFQYIHARVVLLGYHNNYDTCLRRKRVRSYFKRTAMIFFWGGNYRQRKILYDQISIDGLRNRIGGTRA